MRRTIFIMLTAMLIAGSMEWPLTCSRERTLPDCCRGGACMMKMHRDMDRACLCSRDALSKEMLVAVRGILAPVVELGSPDFVALAESFGEAALDRRTLPTERPPKRDADFLLRTCRA